MCDSQGERFLCRTDSGFVEVREVRRGGHLASQSRHNPFRGDNCCNLCRRQGEWQPIKQDREEWTLIKIALKAMNKDRKKKRDMRQGYREWEEHVWRLFRKLL